MVDKNSYNPRYHGTDGVAEKTAITDMCVCVCVWNPTSGEVKGVREHRAIATNHSSNLMEGLRFSEGETSGTWEMSWDWIGKGANVFKSLG